MESFPNGCSALSRSLKCISTIEEVVFQKHCFFKQGYINFKVLKLSVKLAFLVHLPLIHFYIYVIAIDNYFS